MTEGQEKKIRDKIQNIKSTLAAERRFHRGYYDDSRGLRYVPPELYLKIKDYKGASRYFNWFNKNFPDDAAYGVFWFEHAISSFKNKKLEVAEKKIIQSFMDNDYLIDRFLDLSLKDRINNSYSRWNRETATERFQYSYEDREFYEFSNWLKDLIETPRFIKCTMEFVEIQIELKTETVSKKRSALLDRAKKLLEDY